MLKKLYKLNLGLKVGNIKQKYAELQCVVRSADGVQVVDDVMYDYGVVVKEATAIITEAETEALRTCEKCSASDGTVEHYDNGWEQMLCVACRTTQRKKDAAWDAEHGDDQ
jgi:hypothetical protein